MFKELMTLIVVIGVIILYGMAIYNYVVHGEQPSNFVVLTIIVGMLTLKDFEE